MPISYRAVTLFGVAAFLATAGSAMAQTPCQAGVREMSYSSARDQLQRLMDREPLRDDMMADGARCVSDSANAPALWSHLRLVAPTARFEYQGGVPDPRNENGVWTGVGMNAFARLGFSFDYGFVHATMAPEVAYAQNQAYNFFTDTSSTRSPFSSNWYLPPYSIDLPSRFGRAPITTATLGQSAFWVSTGGADFGVSNSSQSWGPGMRGQLMLGADAPGIPRLFLRTNHPVNTVFGSWSATAFLGTLTESPFFDDTTRNDLRTLLAWNVAWRPGGDSSSTVIGFAHASMRTGSPFGGSGQTLTGRSDVMNSLYMRVRSPDDGFRAWAEIARAGAMPSVRKFLTLPSQGLAYLVGFEQNARMAQGTLLLTAEAADLEQPTDIVGQPTQDFYTSRDIPQGWTQRGQILGDGIGPGGQSQWISLDWITPRRSAGLFVERVRWNEDAFLRQYLPYDNRHDVTVRVGVRGGTLYRGQQVNLELSWGKRLDYLFQNATWLPAGYNTVDVPVTQLTISVVPFATSGR